MHVQNFLSLTADKFSPMTDRQIPDKVILNVGVLDRQHQKKNHSDEMFNESTTQSKLKISRI